jgi:glycosyltransferase involved in cell wall biosynthesis
VVVSNEGAPPELVGGGQYGRCATAADPQSFADQLSRLVADSTERAGLGARARERAALFDARQIGARVIAGYRDLTGGV